MNRKKWTAVLLTALMVFQVLVSAVFGEEAGLITLSGKLKIQGAVYVGSALSADFSKAEPAALTNEDVSFQWTRQEGDSLLVLSEEKTYTPVQEDLNSSITLTVTGLAERGFGGSLTVKSNPVAQTAEEAEALAAQTPDEDASAAEGAVPSDGTDPYTNTDSADQTWQNPEGYQEYTEYPAGDANMQYTDGYEEYPAEDPNMQYTEGYEEYPAEDPNAQYTEGYEEYQTPEAQYTEEYTVYNDPEAQYTDPNVQYTDPNAQYSDPNAQYTDPNAQYIDPNVQNTEGYEEFPAANAETGFPETGDVPGMENVNEEIYIYDPATGQEVTPVPEAQDGAPQAADGTQAADGMTDAAGNAQETADGTAAAPYQAEVTLENEAQQIDFGTVDEDTVAESEAQYFTVTNTGTEPLNFEGIAPEHFMVGDIVDTLQPGTSVSLYIVPREGVAPGEYKDEIVYRSVEGAEASFTAQMKVEESAELSSGAPDSDYEEPEPDTTGGEDDYQVIEENMDGEEGENTEGEPDPDSAGEDEGISEEENETDPSQTGDDPAEGEGDDPAEGEGDDPAEGEGDDPEEGEGDDPASEAELVLSLDVAPSALDFGSLEEGYAELPEAQAVTVTNTGSVSVLLDQPTAEYFYVTELETAELAPGEAAEFMVWPMEGLSANEYTETINILYQGGSLPEGYDEATTTIKDEGGPYSVNAAFTVTKPSKEYKLTVSPESYDFGTRTIAYQDAPEAASFTVTNKGNTAVVLNTLSSASYEVSGFSADEIGPEESAVFTVRPKVGLAAGDYPETLTVSTTDADGNILLLAAVQVKFSVKAEEKIYKIVLDRSLVDFGTVEAGYVNPPAAQKVTVTNTGNTEVTLSRPTAINFRVGGLSSTKLKPGETSSFTIVPLTGLGQGQYFEAVTVTGSGVASASVNANFIVSARTIVLTGIINPADITGIRNGTEKTVAGLRLPGSVTISTNSGNMSAAVTWDVASCAYDPSLRTPQTFIVNGRVTLPGGVTNPSNIPLIASVRVTVNGRDPIVPDASGNQVIGIYSGDVYTTDDKISFSAAGAGYGNVSPVQGDIRYVPYCWNVLDNRVWDCEPFSASFRMGAPGNYVLTVTFLQQQFNGSTWVNTGVSDVRKISFTVRQGRTVTMTPIPGQVRPARTGDDNNILPLIIALAAAGAAIAAAVVVLIRRRRK